jgi:hypothetical protein
MKYSSKIGILSMNINGFTSYTTNPGLTLKSSNDTRNELASLNLNFYAEKNYLDY